MSWRLIKSKNLKYFSIPFLLFIFLWIIAGFPLQTVILFVLVLGHELTHMLVAKLYGIEIRKIELFPFGGVGYLAKPLEMNPVKNFWWPVQVRSLT